VARNYYAEINLHLVWHTKASAALLVPQVEAVVHHYLRGRCVNTPGVFVHEIGGTENHVHLVMSVSPTVLVSDLVGQLKGASSHEANGKFGHHVLDWQAGYGMVSFGTRDLEWVRVYVRNQKERHAKGQVEERLERITAAGKAEAERREGP
jgi:putative transposase